MDAITGIAAATIEFPTNKPADFTKVRLVISVKPILDELLEIAVLLSS